MLTVTLPLYLLVIANAALIVAATFAVMRVERALRESQKFWSSPTGAAIQADRPDEPDRSRLIAHRLGVLQKAIEDLGQRTAPMPQNRIVDLSLEHAVRMAKRGASVEELTNDCGLNVGEAELLHRLHGKQKNVMPIVRSA